MSSPKPFALFAAIWLPRFQLQAVMRIKPPARGAAVAVLDCDENGADSAEENKSRILHANDAAQRRHVEPGMTATQAQARCSGLVLWRRDAGEEVRVQQLLLECAVQWTPDYESAQPGLCILDLSRVREARQRAATCAEEMRRWLEAMQLEARIGVAPDPDLACLTARAAHPVLVLNTSPEHEQDWLAQLPITALQPTAAISEVLNLWGIQSLAQLAALRREDIAARLGVEGALLWDVVRGGKGRLLRLVRPVAGFGDSFEFEHPVETIEPLLFLLGRMLGDLCLRLAEVWLLASALRLGLRFEDQTVYERTLRVAEPTRDAGLLLRVLHTHLDGRSASAPIIAVSLELAPARPAAQQTNLFERRLRDPNQFSETLARLEALLGRGNVGRVQLLPSRRTDAFAVVNYLDEKTSQANAAQQRGSIHHGLPLRCFRPPRPTEVTLSEGRPQEIEVKGSRLAVVEARGPWLMSGDWWDRHLWAREIWEAATSDGTLYQLARERDGWVLDGTLG